MVHAPYRSSVPLRLLLVLLLGPLVALHTIDRSVPVEAAAGVYHGVYQPGAPHDMTRLADFERDAGKSAAIVMWYQDWVGNGTLDPTLLRGVAAHGSVPMITWEPWDATRGVNQPAFSLAAISTGTHDAYVQRWAQGLAVYGGPVLLRWGHEMNGDWYPWGAGINGNTPAQYIAAWRRLYGIFQAAGATNVQWVWSPNVVWADQAAFEPFFPGDAAVHWLGLDGYNWGTTRGGSTSGTGTGSWQSFTQVFAASYGRITALSPKPLMIAETASAEDGGNKAAWITDALAQRIPTTFPRIRAVIWFNEQKERDWRIQSSVRTRRAYAQAVASPVYRGTWP